MITSRSQDWDPSEILSLDHLDRSSSQELLELRSGLKDPDGAHKLAETLGDHPLALIQAAAYIKENKVPSFEEYSARLGNSGEGRVSSTWAVTLEKIKEQAPEVLEILQCLSFLAPDHLPLFFLKMMSRT